MQILSARASDGDHPEFLGVHFLRLCHILTILLETQGRFLTIEATGIAVRVGGLNR